MSTYLFPSLQIVILRMICVDGKTPVTIRSTGLVADSEPIQMRKVWFSQHFLCFSLYFFAGYMSFFSNLFHSLVGLKNAKERYRRDYLLGLISLYLEIRGYHDSAHRAILRTSRMQSPRWFLPQFLTDNCQSKTVGGLRSRLICRIDVR